MRLNLRSLISINWLFYLRPLAVITFLLLIYRFFQRFIIDHDTALNNIISVGILFSSLVWLILLPLIYLLYKWIRINEIIKFLLVQIGSAVAIGLAQTILYVYLHNLFWPGILVPKEQLSPLYVLADLRINFFIYWMLLGGFYIQEYMRRNSVTNKGAEYLEVKGNSGIVNIFFQDISCIKALGNYVLIVEVLSTGKKTHIVRNSMNNLQLVLPYPNFLRVQKSFIINKNYLKSYERGKHGEFKLTLETGDKISTSRNKIPDIKLWLANDS